MKKYILGLSVFVSGITFCVPVASGAATGGAAGAAVGSANAPARSGGVQPAGQTPQRPQSSTQIPAAAQPSSGQSQGTDQSGQNTQTGQNAQTGQTGASQT